MQQTGARLQKLRVCDGFPPPPTLPATLVRPHHLCAELMEQPWL